MRQVKCYDGPMRGRVALVRDGHITVRFDGLSGGVSVRYVYVEYDGWLVYSRTDVV